MTNNSGRAADAASAMHIDIEALTCDEQGRWLLVQPAGSKKWSLVGGPAKAFEELASAAGRLGRAQIGHNLVATRPLVINRVLDQHERLQFVLATERIYFDELRYLRPQIGHTAALRFVFPREARDLMAPAAYTRATAAWKVLSSKNSGCAYLENGLDPLSPSVLRL